MQNRYLHSTAEILDNLSGNMKRRAKETQSENRFFDKEDKRITGGSHSSEEFSEKVRELSEAKTYASYLEKELGIMRPELKRAKFDLETYRQSLQTERTLRQKAEGDKEKLEDDLKDATRLNEKLDSELRYQRQLEQQGQAGMNKTFLEAQQDIHDVFEPLRSAVQPTVPHTWSLDGSELATLLDVVQCVQGRYGRRMTSILLGINVVFDAAVKCHNRRLHQTMLSLLNPTLEREFVILVFALHCDDNFEVEIKYKF